MKAKSLVAPLFPLLAVGCGGSPAGAPAEAVAPKTQTANEALGEKVECNPEGLKNGGNPLIIDWKSTDRADLEVLMGESVAMVKFSCDKGVELLPECQVVGDYGYRGVSVKSTTLSLKSADEVSANLTGGALVPVAIDAELKRGNSLQLAYFLVGKQSTARPFVAREELTGACDGATHFVRRADIGAFAMTTAASGEVSGALELFGQATSAGSSTSKKVATTDGDPKSCDSADPDAESPPKTCRAVIRLTLLPIDDAPLQKVAQEKAEGPGKKVALADGRGCPVGFVLVGEKCEKKTAEVTTYLCAKDDEAECKSMCEKNELKSCGRYANLLLAGDNDDRIDEAKPLLAQLTKACEELQEPVACGVAGWLTDDNAASLKLQVAGCKAGYPHSCQELRDFLIAGHRGAQKDPERYGSILEAACKAGSSMACAFAADELLSGEVIKRDTGKGRAFAKRSCDAGSFFGCMVSTAALLPRKACLLMAGEATDIQSWCSPEEQKPDLPAAVAAGKRACKLEARACEQLEGLKSKCADVGICDAFKD